MFLNVKTQTRAFSHEGLGRALMGLFLLWCIQLYEYVTRYGLITAISFPRLTLLTLSSNITFPNKPAAWTNLHQQKLPNKSGN